MSDNESTAGNAQNRLGRISHEIETKAIYVALAGVFALNAAGVFSFDVPSAFFVFVFVIALLIDAYR